MNYYNKTIKIDALGAGTTDIMEWIRDNGCPNLCYTEFVDKRNNEIAMVSKGNESMFRATLDAIEEGIYEWFEYKGMKRHSGSRGYWMFLIDGNYYWATR